MRPSAVGLQVIGVATELTVWVAEQLEGIVVISWLGKVIDILPLRGTMLARLNYKFNTTFCFYTKLLELLITTLLIPDALA